MGGMSESYNEKRVKFLSKNAQKEFFKLIENKLSGDTKKIAKISRVGVRQISDWRNAKYTLSLIAFENLLKVTKIARPTSVQIIDQYSHVKSAGKKGFKIVLKKYGEIPKNEKLRRENWEKWWGKIGKYQEHKIFEKKMIIVPRNGTDLAEFCGILIGDGGVTKYQVTITLNYETDKEYSTFVVKLIKRLFKVKPKLNIIKGSKAMNICVSRKNVVDFLHKKGIIIGNKLKQNLSIPEWIVKSKKYLRACIRGMVDTDGSVVIETHHIKGKKYIYYRLSFTSASPILASQAYEAFKSFGFTPKIRRKGRSIQLENIQEICDYFKRIGTSNPKHLERLGRSGSSGLRHRS